MAISLPLGRLEITFAVSLLIYLLVGFLSGSLLAELAALLVTAGLGLAVAVKLIRQWARKLLWRLRSRMIVVYLLIGVIPSVLLVSLVVIGARYLTGQVAVYMVHSELDRRLSTMSGAAQMLARAPAERRSALLERMHAFYQERFPGFQVIVEEGSADPGEISAVVVKDDLLYACAQAAGASKVTILTPVTRRWLAELAPGLGDISIVHFPEPRSGSALRPRAMRTHDAPAASEDTEAAIVPPPMNRLDFEVLWATKIPVTVWDSPGTQESALLAVHSRMSAVLTALFALKTESPLPGLLYGLAIVLAAVHLISVFIGVSLTQTITGAVHNLYEGTQRVIQGDFAHRIEVRGNEQIAELSRSFNRMTENLERLLEVAKEKERLQAELEIAREVQSQLFPRSMPSLKTLELRALCRPARMVSGDCYDCQALPGSKVALAIGDVAGKGISAALLMATLQSSLRTQVRECLETASVAESASRVVSVSTSTLVSRLNLQLYADTAPEKYATFYFAIYDDETGLLTYTNAGHLPPILVRSGRAMHLDVNGMIVGAFPFAKYEESHMTLEAGDLLVAYTDGMTEPENEFGEMFGEERLVETLLRCAHLETSQIADALIEAVNGFTGSPELQDDMTLIVARRHA